VLSVSFHWGASAANGPVMVADKATAAPGAVRVGDSTANARGDATLSIVNAP
jgi:hypothetical protein